jgi:hypothetical protein
MRLYQRGRPRVLIARRVVREAKAGRPCADCRIAYPHYVLDFDHRPGEEKTANINVLAKRGAAVSALRQEMAKCDIVCANCHRKRTWRRKQDGQPSDEQQAGVAEIAGQAYIDL